MSALAAARGCAKRLVERSVVRDLGDQGLEPDPALRRRHECSSHRTRAELPPQAREPGSRLRPGPVEPADHDHGARAYRAEIERGAHRVTQAGGKEQQVALCTRRAEVDQLEQLAVLAALDACAKGCRPRDRRNADAQRPVPAEGERFRWPGRVNRDRVELGIAEESREPGEVDRHGRIVAAAREIEADTQRCCRRGDDLAPQMEQLVGGRHAPARAIRQFADVTLERGDFNADLEDSRPCH